MLHDLLAALLVLCGLLCSTQAGAPPPGVHPPPPHVGRIEPPRDVLDRGHEQKHVESGGTVQGSEHVSLSQNEQHALSMAHQAPQSLVYLTPLELHELLPALQPKLMLFLLNAMTLHPHSEIAQFAREEKIDPHAPPPDAGARLVDWVLGRKVEISKHNVRVLTSAGKWLLDSYIEKEHPDRKVNFDSEVEFWEKWEGSRRKRVDDARDGFPAFGLRGVGEQEIFAAVPDQHDARYLRQANAAYIKAHPPLARLQSEGWQFEGVDPRKLGLLLEALVQPVPGTEPILTYFIDPKADDHDLMTGEITAAWKSRSVKTPSYLLHDDISRFLESVRGRSVILVGHIADQYFAMERGPDKPPLMLNIPELILTAAQYQVLLFPIGCNSAKAGAPYGFTRPIDSIEVAKFIAAIPRSDIQIADVLAAMGKIAPVVVDASSFTDYIDVVLRPKPEVSYDPYALVRIPVSAYVRTAPTNIQVGSVPSSYQQFASEWIAANRPWYDRGWLATLRTFIRHTTGAGLLATALALAALFAVLRLLRRRIEGTTAATGTRLYGAECTLLMGSVLLAIIAVVYAVIAALWSEWLVWGLFAVFFVLGTVFKIADKANND
jgi:hypothetical protein